MGTIVGGGIVLLWAFIFLITIADLLYITIPPIRNILYKGGGAGAGAQGGMMGGGMRGGMMGGMGGGNADLKPTQWISDEAVNCVALLGAGPRCDYIIIESLHNIGQLTLGCLKGEYVALFL